MRQVMVYEDKQGSSGVERRYDDHHGTVDCTVFFCRSPFYNLVALVPALDVRVDRDDRRVRSMFPHPIALSDNHLFIGCMHRPVLLSLSLSLWCCCPPTPNGTPAERPIPSPFTLNSTSTLLLKKFCFLNGGMTIYKVVCVCGVDGRMCVCVNGWQSLSVNQGEKKRIAVPRSRA